MKINQVAAQLYTVRDYMGNATQIAESLKKVRDIGYTAVQTNRFQNVSDEDLAKMLRDNGLTLCATHEDSQALLSDPKSIAEAIIKMGCTNTSYPYPGGVKLESLSDAQALAAKLNAAGKVMADGGVILSYHNHSIEFKKFEGRTVLEVIYGETDPHCLHAEIDTYWVQYGGGNPEDWCRRVRGRMTLLHLKDFAMNEKAQPMFAEIGSGNLNWPGIISAAEASGCQWFIVEQDVCPGDPFDSLKKSFDYIKANLVS
jgi:sugar phosphate isomerase/epimerase